MWAWALLSLVVAAFDTFEAESGKRVHDGRFAGRGKQSELNFWGNKLEQ